MQNLSKTYKADIAVPILKEKGRQNKNNPNITRYEVHFESWYEYTITLNNMRQKWGRLKADQNLGSRYPWE